MDKSNFGKSRESTGRDPSIRITTSAWLKKHRTEVLELQRSREVDPQATTVLLIPAAQHPLDDGITPGPEFVKRLVAARDRYYEYSRLDRPVEFFLPGSRHHDSKSGQTDKVALYDAAGKWLTANGVPASILHGKDWIDAYRPQGLYSGAAEIAVAADGFIENERFRSAEYFCSPGQVSRAERYALANNIPLRVEVPKSLQEGQAEQYHKRSAKMVAINGLMRSVDPYGEGLLARLTRDRVPEDGNLGTVAELQPDYADLPWYSEQEK